MTPDFRALCAELVDVFDNPSPPQYKADVLTRARDALAEHTENDPSQISDGFHTFAELYEHRHALTLSLMKAKPELFWFSRRHNDGELCFGTGDWFIIGAELPVAGSITYHLPMALWESAQRSGAAMLKIGRPWDGHTPGDVVERLKAWAALAEQPVAEGPTDEELREMFNENDWNYISPETFEDIARAVLDRWGRPMPQPPADGDVAELVEWLHRRAAEVQAENCTTIYSPHLLRRVADLLAQRYPAPVPVLPDDAQIIEPAEHTLLVPVAQPVPVSERWPDFSDCDPQERVWAWNPVLDHWKLSRINRSVHTHWLPANALPTPEAANA